MKKIVVITDTHLKQGNEDLVFDIFDQTIQYCLDNDIKRVFHAGDFFTSRTSQSLSVLNVTRKIFNLFNFKDVGLTIIPGNHDKVDLESEDSYLDIFSNYPNIQVIRKETSLPVFNEDVDDVHLLPYFKENGSYLERLSNLQITPNSPIYKNPSKNLLITHIAISGVKNNDNSLVDNNLKTDLFNRFDLVITGHYHNRQQIKDNIWYIGSSHAQNYGEDNDKGICVVDENLNIEFVQLNFPRYNVFRFECSEINKMVESLSKLKINDYNRFIIKGSPEEVDNFNDSIFNKRNKGINLELKYEKTSLNSKVELKKYKDDDIMLAFKNFALEKNVNGPIYNKCEQILQKVL